MNNHGEIIIANFNSCGTSVRTASLDQYDYGAVLRIQGLILPPAVEIHFCLQETGGEVQTRIGVTKDGVTDVVIPDSMLENDGATQDYRIYAWVYLSDETSGEAIGKIIMPVKSRSKPEAFPGTGETSLGSIMESVNKIADEKADGIRIIGDKMILMSGDKVIQEIDMNIDGGTFDDWRDE